MLSTHSGGDEPKSRPAEKPSAASCGGKAKPPQPAEKARNHGRDDEARRSHDGRRRPAGRALRTLRPLRLLHLDRHRRRRDQRGLHHPEPAPRGRRLPAPRRPALRCGCERHRRRGHGHAPDDGLRQRGYRRAVRQRHPQRRRRRQAGRRGQAAPHDRYRGLPPRARRAATACEAIPAPRRAATARVMRPRPCAVPPPRASCDPGPLPGKRAIPQAPSVFGRRFLLARDEARPR